MPPAELHSGAPPSRKWRSRRAATPALLAATRRAHSARDDASRVGPFRSRGPIRTAYAHSLRACRRRWPDCVNPRRQVASAQRRMRQANMYIPSGTLSSHSVRERQRSATSLTSDHSGCCVAASSMSSDRHQTHYDERSTPAAGAPTTPNKSADMTPRANNVMSNGPDHHPCDHTNDDRRVLVQVHAPCAWERRSVRSGTSASSGYIPTRRRCIGVQLTPGSSNVSESSAKSGMFVFHVWVSRVSSRVVCFLAYIEAVRSVLDPNPMPPVSISTASSFQPLNVR